MFVMDWISSVITITVTIGLYLLVLYRKPDVNWGLFKINFQCLKYLTLFSVGSSTQEQTYKTALNAAIRLQKVSDHAKNYHPQVLVLCDPQTRPPLVDFANMITNKNSLLFVGQILQNKISYKARMETIKAANKWLDARKIKAFFNVVDNIGFEDGVRSLIQASGFGKFIPNILMMGYKSDWRSCPKKDLTTYFNVLQ